MILNLTRSWMQSNGVSTGPIAETFDSNEIIAQVPNDVCGPSGKPGIFKIYGNGAIQGFNNPTNTTPDVVSFNWTDLSSTGSHTLFSKIFTTQLTFDFEIMSALSAVSGNSPEIVGRISFSDGTTIVSDLSGFPNRGTAYSLSLSSASGLYAVAIFFVCAEIIYR